MDDTTPPTTTPNAEHDHNLPQTISDAEQRTLARARQRVSQHRAAALRIESRLRKTERARDTRRKILVGAAMIGLARKDPAAARIFLQALRTLEAKDQPAVKDLVRELSQAPEPPPLSGHPSPRHHQPRCTPRPPR